MMVDAKLKLEHYYNLTSEIYTVATVLDPALKLAYHRRTSGSGHQDVDDVLKTVRNTCDKYARINTPTRRASTSSRATNSPASLWSEILDDIDTHELAQRSDELDIYVNQPRANITEDMLLWWANHEGQFPTLAAMARDFLAVPATSAPSERAFSLGRQLISQFRHGLEIDTVGKCMCLKAWLKQVDY